MIVIPHTESLLDQIADHGASPDSARVPGLYRAGFYERHQLGALLLCQLTVGPRWNVGQEPICSIGLVPLEPTIHGTTCDACFSCELNYTSALDIAQYSSTSAPPIEILGFQAFSDEPYKPSTRTTAASLWTDRAPRLCTLSIRCWHDRTTMILSRSRFNLFGSHSRRSWLDTR